MPFVAMVGHDSIRCVECGAYVRACDLCFAQHECVPARREAYLVQRFRQQLDSGAFLVQANDWLAHHESDTGFFDYAIWRRAHWHAQQG